MDKFRFGQVDLDTSHPPSFARILMEQHGGALTAVLDGGAVLTPAEVEAYAAERGGALVCANAAEMVPLVDLVLVQSVNWDRHRPMAEPFIEAGIPVFVDKPLAGSLEDCRWFLEQQQRGALICGCSSLPSAHEISAYLAEPLETRGTIQIAYSTVGVDEFNYAIHAAETLEAVLGPGFEAVRSLGDADNRQVFQARHRSGAIALWHQCGGWTTSNLTLTTTKGVRQIAIDSSQVYAALLARVVEAFQEERQMAPLAPTAEAVTLLLAAKVARDRPDEWISLLDPALEHRSFDGHSFAIEYAHQRRASL